MQKQKTTRWIFGIFLAILFALVLANLTQDTISDIFFALITGLTSIFIGMVIAFLLKQPVMYFEKKLLKNAFQNSKNPEKIKRMISLTVVFILFLLIFVAFISIIVPNIIATIQEISENSHSYILKIEEELTAFVSGLPFTENLEIRDFVNQAITEIVNLLSSSETTITTQLANIFTIVASIVGTTVLSLFFAFLFLKEKEKIKKSTSRFVYAFFGQKRADNIVGLTQKADKILLNYAVSKLFEAIIIFIVVGIALLVIGAPMPFIMSAIMAILNVIPYIGPIIALVPIALVTIVFSTVNVALLAILISLIIVIIVTGLISPIIIGKKINLDILLVLIAMVIGGAMFGMLGLIFAPPVMAILLFYLNHKIEEKENLRANENVVTMLERVEIENKENLKKENKENLKK